MKNLAVNIGDNFNTPFGKTGGLGLLVSVIVSNALIVAGALLLILLVFGGFSVIVGAGTSDPQKTAQGKSAATAALIGFVLIFAAYWIVQLVEVITGLEILNPPL